LKLLNWIAAALLLIPMLVFAGIIRDLLGEE
jgi:hypothetical protein